MDYRKDAVSLAVMSLLVCTGMATAETASPKLSLQPTVNMEEAPAPRAPLMAGLDAIGAAKPLDSIGLNISGYVEAGYIYNPGYSNYQNNVGQGMGIGTSHNKPVFDQIGLSIERLVDLKKFDVGGKVTVLWGADSNGISSTGEEAIQHPSDDDPTFEFLEYYVDVAIPVGNGLKVRVGKFSTLMGYEYVNPALNAFYTHSYAFGYAEPFTHTGAVAFYNLNDQWAVAGGLVRGWDDSLEDKNSNGIGAIGQISYTPWKGFQNYLTAYVGPEQATNRVLLDGSVMGSRANDRDRVALDYVGTYQLTDRLSLGLNVDWIYDGGADSNGGSSTWWGTAGYVSYTINDYLTANARLEWFNDQNGATGLSDSSAINVYAISLGLTIKPMPKDPIGSNLKIRPEVRYDYAEKDIYGGGDRQDQWLMGGDIIFTF